MRSAWLAPLVGRLRVQRAPAAEAAGMGLMVAGVWQIFEPAAFLLAGAALVVWARGARTGGP